MKLFLLLSLLLVGTEGFVNENKDRLGNNIHTMPIKLDAKDSKPTDCQMLCSNRRTCRAWSYDSCGKQDCYLKYKASDPVTRQCKVR